MLNDQTGFFAGDERLFTRWQRQTATAVHTEIKRIIRAHSTDPDQEARYLAILQTYWQRFRLGRHTPFCLWLPLYVCWAVDGQAETAVRPTAITTLAWLGAAFYDDLTDQEVPTAWQQLTAAEITMTAFALMSVIPLAAIDGLVLDVCQKQSMRHALSQGLLRGLAGQEGDLATADCDDVTLSMIEQIVLGKSGAMIAFCAAFGAIAAGAPPDVVSAYGNYGEALGMVHQISSDAADIFQQAWSQDLATGVKNIQTVACLAQLVGTERTAFLELLAEARTSAAAQTAVRQQLRQTQAALPWIDMAHRYDQQANRALDLAQPLPAIDGLLRQLVAEKTPAIDMKTLLAYRLRSAAVTA
ncbi:MAG: polyprenyl synthetase family protein [Chloroflexota bacterium]